MEQAIENEQQIIADIIASMQRLDQRTHAMYGQHVRVSHGKSHGVAVGELTVLDNLPTHLARGLFAKPATYPVIVRLASVPGEITTDAVNTQWGFAFKILNVEVTYPPDFFCHPDDRKDDKYLSEKNASGPASRQ